jgi:hypothetical protein
MDEIDSVGIVVCQEWSRECHDEHDEHHGDANLRSRVTK